MRHNPRLECHRRPTSDLSARIRAFEAYIRSLDRSQMSESELDALTDLFNKLRAASNAWRRDVEQ